MNEGVEKTIEYAANLVRDLREHAADVDARISAWVIAGNGAALLLCLNALLAHQICVWTAVRPFAFLFAIGLGTAFASVILTLLLAERTTHSMSEIVAAGQRSIIFYKRYEGKRQRLEAIAAKENPTESDIAEVKDTEDEVADILTAFDKVPSTQRAALYALASRLLISIGIASFGAGILVAISSDALARSMCQN